MEKYTGNTEWRAVWYWQYCQVQWGGIWPSPPQLQPDKGATIQFLSIKYLLTKLCTDCFDHWRHTNRRCVGETIGNRQRCQLLGPPSEGSLTPIFTFFYKKCSLSSFAGRSPKLASENLGVWTASGDIFPQFFSRVSFLLFLLRFRSKEIHFRFFGWLNMGYRLLESLFNCQLRFLAVYQVVCLGSSFCNF